MPNDHALPRFQFPLFRLTSVAAILLTTHTMLAAPGGAQQAAAAQTAPTTQAGPQTRTQARPDRSSAYYHYGLAHLYEEMAVNAGRPDYATQAVEEYKLALDADPTSTELQDGLADLYFKIGRIARTRDRGAGAGEEEPGRPTGAQAAGQGLSAILWATCRARRRPRCCTWRSRSTRRLHV